MRFLLCLIVIWLSINPSTFSQNTKSDEDFVKANLVGRVFSYRVPENKVETQLVKGAVGTEHLYVEFRYYFIDTKHTLSGVFVVPTSVDRVTLLMASRYNNSTVCKKIENYTYSGGKVTIGKTKYSYSNGALIDSEKKGMAGKRFGAGEMSTIKRLFAEDLAEKKENSTDSPKAEPKAKEESNLTLESAQDYAKLANKYRNAAASQDDIEQSESIYKALSVYNEMKTKFPNSADYANFMAARTILVLDPDQKQGLAVPYYKALFESISEAGVKDNNDKTRISEACQYLGIYYFKIKKNNASAKPYFVKLLEVDPDNSLAKQVLEVIK